jgi:hypothetical protein
VHNRAALLLRLFAEVKQVSQRANFAWRGHRVANLSARRAAKREIIGHRVRN